MGLLGLGYRLVKKTPGLPMVIPRWASELKGFSASITTDHLATYLTKNWFTNEHKNQMLYLLQKEVLRIKRGEEIEVCDTFFTKRLLDIHTEVSGQA
jgi:hypothetical protein